MSIQDLGAIGELLAAIATLATLIYLARQIKQNTQEIRSSNYHGIKDSFNAINVMIATNPGLAKVFKDGNASFSSLTEDEQVQYNFVIHAAFRVMDVLHYQSHNGTGDTTLWEAEIPTIRNLLTPKGAREWWKARPYNYSTEFVKYVEESVIPNLDGDA